MNGLLQSRTVQAAFVGAVVTAIGSVAAAMVGAVMQVRDAPSAAGSPPAIVRTYAPGGGTAPGECVAMDDAVMRFAARFPDAARRYARGGAGNHGRLPALATPEEIALCGDPERLLAALYR